MALQSRFLKYADFPKQKHPLLRAILNHGGSVTLFAKALGIHRQKVFSWLDNSSIAPPPKYCLRIEEITNGVVTTKQLRPDIFGDAQFIPPSLEEKCAKLVGLANDIASEVNEKILKKTDVKKHKKEG